MSLGNIAVTTLFSSHRWSHFSRFPPGPYTMHKATTASAEGDMRATIGAFPPGQSLWTSCSLPCTFCLVDFVNELGSLSYGKLNFSFRALYEDELLIAASVGGLMPYDAEDSAGLPPVCGSSV